MPGKILNEGPKCKDLPSKPSIKSKVFSPCVLSFLFDKKKELDKSSILYNLVKNIFIGDEVSIKDNYSTLVTYLVLHAKEISYDVFCGTYESITLSCEAKHDVCYILPYGAVIASGLIFQWQQEQQSQVVSKMLKIHRNRPDSRNVALHFLTALNDFNVNLSGNKLKKIIVDSPTLLYFLLSIDNKHDNSEGNTFYTSENVYDVIEIYLQDEDLFASHEKMSVLLAKKLLKFGSETLLKFWSKLMESYDNERNDYKELMILRLMSSILEYCSPNEFHSEINKLFTPSIVKMLSKTSPKIEPVFTSINDSLKQLSLNIEGSVKLSIIDVILLNAEKYSVKSLVVKLCDTLVMSMTFEEISHVSELYKQVIMGQKHKAMNKSSKERSDFNEFEKIHCARFFSKLTSLNVCKYQVTWRKTQLKFLFKVGFLSENKDIVGPDFANVARKLFYLSLNQKFVKLVDLDKILKKLVKFAGEGMNNKEKHFVFPFKDNAYTFWFQGLNVLNKLKECEDEDKLVFKILVRYMMLFMFYDYPIAKNSLEELFKVIEHKETRSELHWTEVTIDLFLHLLSGNDNLHKNVIHSTFSHVSKHLTMKGLNLLLSAVKGKEGGHEEASSLNDSGESEDGSEEVDSDDETNSDEESESGDEMEDAGQMDKLKYALRQELYKIDTASTCGSVDLEDLDEEEGKQLNSTLGQIFKGQHNFKSSNKIKVDNLELHFRIRAINLLEIYIENEPPLFSSVLVLSNIISDLKASIPNNTLAPFTVSLKRCLRKLTDLKDFSDCSCVTETSLCSTFNEILMRECPTSAYQDMTEQIVDACMFLIRCSARVSESSGEMASCLKSTLKTYFKDIDSPVPFLLFTSIFSSLSLEKLIPLTTYMVKNTFSDNLKSHKRTQALQLLITFYNNNRLFKNLESYQKSLMNLEETIVKNSLKFVSKFEETDINKKYSCMFLDLLVLVKTKSQLISAEPSVHWNDLSTIINKLSTIPVFRKELKISFANFCKKFNHNINDKSSSKSPLDNKKRKNILTKEVTAVSKKKKRMLQ